MAEIVWTEEAEPWLCDIHDYIAADNSNISARKATKIERKFYPGGTS